MALSPASLGLVVGVLIWLARRYLPSLLHFWGGLKTVFAFGAEPQAFFSSMHAEGRPIVPFTPMLGRKAHMLLDGDLMLKVYGTPATKLAYIDLHYEANHHIFGCSSSWWQKRQTFIDTMHALYDGLKRGPIETLSASFVERLEVELLKLVERVEAAPGGKLRVPYEESIGQAFFDAAHVAVFGELLPLKRSQDLYMRFDAGFPQLGLCGSLPLPLAISNRLIAADATRARDELALLCRAWIEKGDYKTANDMMRLPIDAMRDGGIDPTDQGAVTIGAMLALHSNSLKTLSWLLMHLLQSPECMRRSKAEIAAFRASGDAITATSLPARLPFLTSLFTETLRFTSSVFSLRLTVEDTHLALADGSTYNVPAGEVLLCANMATNLDPRYFDEPETFKPDRFLDESGAFAGSKHSLHFGGGAGMCKGRVFAVFNELYTIMRAIELFSLRFDGLVKTTGKPSTDSFGATKVLPGVVLGRDGTGTLSPDSDFVLVMSLATELA